jgi:flagellar assembly factor FliW
MTATPATLEATGMNATHAMLTYRSSQLGDVTYTASDVVHFAQGVPGFESLHDFLIVTRDECAPFVFLTSLENVDVALPLLPWALAAGERAIALPTESLHTADDAPDAMLACYAVVWIGPEGRRVVANLRAPIVVNLDRRTGRQVILADESLPLTATVRG